MDDCANYGYTTDANMATGSWKNLQIVYDGTQGNNSEKLKFYVNGDKKTLSFSGTIPATLQNPAANLEFGGDSDTATYLRGILDDVRVYNRALIPSEVEGLSQYGPGPVGWWKMDEGSGTTANDTSGNGRTGTLQDGAGWDSGKYGKGVQMDGNNDSVQINDF
jgi:hypothetical protein